MKHYWIFLLLFGTILAQNNKNPLFLPLSNDGKTYIKAGFRSQFWLRYTQANEQTTINKEEYDAYFDFSIRRIRMSVQAQLTPKLFLFVQMGGNSYNSKTEKNFKPQILDLYAEYEFHPSIAIGGGKIGWDAPSRWNVFSNGNMLSIDAMAFSQFTLNKHDDNGRSLGIYLKGTWNKLSYHLTLKNPTFSVVNTPTANTDFITQTMPKKRWSGYMKYDFLEVESNKHAYSGAAGTYLGKKKIFNIGAGFAYQPKATGNIEAEKLNVYDYKSWAVEAFFDSPISKNNNAITAYLGYFHSDLGKNYLRYMSSNNIADSSEKGNAYPAVGTGNTIFFQAGYLLAHNKKTKILWQPSLSVQYSKFDRLSDSVWFFDSGVNIYFKGQDSKLSLGIQNRPIFNKVGKSENRKNTFVLQYQIQI